MRRLLLFFCFALNASCVFADEDPWYQTAPGCVIDGGNPQRTNVYHNVLPIDISKPLVQQWKVKVNNPDSNIVCFKDSIITVDGAIDTKTGKQIWKSNIPIETINVPYGAGQIYKDRQFVVGYLPEKGSVLYQVDPASGKILETNDIDKPDFHGSSLVLYNDVAYLLDFNGTVVAYDIKLHKVLWSYITKTKKPYGKRLAIDQNYLAFINDDYLTELDAKTGKPIFRFKTFYGIGPAFTGDKVCEWGYNKIQCYNVEDGEKVLDIYDETILPAQGIIYPSYAFFSDANIPNKFYEIDFANPPAKNEVNNFIGYARASFFGIGNAVYYYDYDHSAFCSYAYREKKTNCTQCSEYLGFSPSYQMGLIGQDNYGHIFLFKA